MSKDKRFKPFLQSKLHSVRYLFEEYYKDIIKPIREKMNKQLGRTFKPVFKELVNFASKLGSVKKEEGYESLNLKVGKYFYF